MVPSKLLQPIRPAGHSSKFSLSYSYYTTTGPARHSHYHRASLSQFSSVTVSVRSVLASICCHDAPINALNYRLISPISAYVRHFALVSQNGQFMGSMATSDVTKPDNVFPKEEPLDALTPSSVSTSPEPDSATIPTEGTSASQDPPPVPKRKGGRKPVSLI